MRLFCPRQSSRDAKSPSGLLWGLRWGRCFSWWGRGSRKCLSPLYWTSGSVGREALPAVVLWAGHVPSLSGPWREVASLWLWVSHLRGHFWQINPLDGTCIDDHALRCLLGQVCGVGFRAEPRQVRAWGWTGKRNQGSSGAWSSPPGLALSLPRLLPRLSLCQNVRRGGVFGALLALPPPPFHLYLLTHLMEDHITGFQATRLAQHAEVGYSKRTCPLFGHTDPD